MGGTTFFPRVTIQLFKPVSAGEFLKRLRAEGLDEKIHAAGGGRVSFSEGVYRLDDVRPPAARQKAKKKRR